MKSGWNCLSLIVSTALALASPVRAADRDSLSFFKNYFVTGDYAVAGVGLRGQGIGGFAQGTINLNAVPAGADVIAAFLYWQTVELTANPSSINGFFRGKSIVGKPLGDPKNAACWSSGGTTGPSGSSGRVCRTDVLRYLPIDATKNIRVANGAHIVRLPDSGGNGNGNAPFTNGATLVVVYRIVVPVQPLIFNFANFLSTTGLTLNGTATNAGTGGALRLTSSGSQAASSWFSQLVPVSNSFTTTFQFKITSVTNPPADGLVFVIQTGGVNAIGGGGGQIGYHGIPGSVAVEFDTYLNNPDYGDIDANHVAIQSNGALPNSSDHRTAANKGINNAPGFNIADGLPHTVTITYAAGILSVRVDTLPTILSVPFDTGTLGLLPGGLARVGFTGSTGANSQITDLLSWSWESK